MPPSGILYFLLGEAAQNHNRTGKYKTHLSAMREKKSGAVRGSPEFGLLFSRGVARENLSAKVTLDKENREPGF